MFARKNVVAYGAEFLGVFILTLVVYSMAVRAALPFITPFTSAIAIGLTIAVLTLVIGNLSGAHVNPAVTISMWVMRKFDILKTMLYISAQILGAVAALALLDYLLNRKIQNIASNDFHLRVLVAEALGAAIFLFGAVAAIMQDFTVVQKAAITGASFAVGIMVASLASNAVLNPAVALGIQSWNWSYVFGPIIGAIIGSNLYVLLFAAGNKKTKK